MGLLRFSLAALVAVFSLTNAQLYIEPASHTGPTGNNYTFTCNAKLQDAPAPTIVWTNSGQEIENDPGQFVVVTVFTQEATSTISTLTILNAEEVDAGEYSCVHKDGGLGKFDGTLDVFDEKVPVIVGDTLIKEGEDITLTCNVDGGTSASSTITWKKDETEILPTADDSNIEIQNNTLRIVEATNANAGTYACVHAYQDTNGASRESIATVIIGGGMELDGSPKSVKYTEGERARFECIAKGSPLPTITWSKENGTTADDRIDEENEVKDDMVTSTLFLRNVNMTDKGNFVCTATNGIDTQSRIILLRVRDRLAALWPFIGIMTEVIVLIAIIFIHEKCTQGEDMGDEDDDEAMEPIKGGQNEEKAASDGEDAVRLRASKE